MYDYRKEASNAELDKINVEEQQVEHKAAGEEAAWRQLVPLRRSVDTGAGAIEIQYGAG